MRISEAIALRWSDLHLDVPAPRLQVSRAIVKGVVGAPKSRHGKRLVPLPTDLAVTLSALRRADSPDDAFVFPGREGGPSDPGALRRRVLVPAAQRAGLTGVGFHTLRHTCAALLGGGLGVSHEDFTDAAARDPRRLALAALVRCVEDERCSASFPHAFPAVLRVTTRTGEELEARVEVNRGGPGNPLSDEELARKFHDNAVRSLPEERAAELAARTLALPDAQSVEDLTALLTSAGER